MPRYVASRTLLAPLDDVWAFLAEPYNLADWWPGVAGVQPDRRGLASGARWQVVRPNEPGYFRRPQAGATLVVGDVVARERIAFAISGDRVAAEIELRATAPERTDVTLAVEAPWLSGVRGGFPRRALERLHDLLQTGAREAR
jgi:uncharacterized protein YndB with AHSA1/START domain